MFNLIIEGLFGTFSAMIFTISIVLLFLFSCLILLLPAKRQWVISKAPSLLTTLGLFGTFCGVAIGLGEFDVSNIDQSVINLISGMKLAFWTSILGMLGSFTIHVFQYIIGCFSENEDDEEDDIGSKIYQLLKEQEKNNSLTKEVQQWKTASIQTNKIIIREIQSLYNAFNSFVDKMAENNSKALIGALEEVVRDFNTKINEQFGDNFRQLNDAVGKLLEWQEHYRKHLEALIEQFKLAQTGIEASRDGIEKIKTNLDAIPMTLTQMRKVIIAIDNGLKESGDTLRAFTALRNQASEVFPSIQKGITNLTDNLTISIQETVNKFQTSTNEQNEIIKKLGETSVAITGNVQTTLKRGVDQVQSVFNEAVEKMKQSTLDSFDTFDKQAEENLSKIMQVMGNNLASIHQKLIDDCQELTDQIRHLVETAHNN